MNKKSKVLIFGIAVAAPFIGMADVQPAALFADGMVIQRETKAPVWGTAEAGETVTVTASWGKSAATNPEATAWIQQVYKEKKNK